MRCHIKVAVNSISRSDVNGAVPVDVEGTSGRVQVGVGGVGGVCRWVWVEWRECTGGCGWSGGNVQVGVGGVRVMCRWV